FAERARIARQSAAGPAVAGGVTFAPGGSERDGTGAGPGANGRQTFLVGAPPGPEGLSRSPRVIHGRPGGRRSQSRRATGGGDARPNRFISELVRALAPSDTAFIPFTLPGDDPARDPLRSAVAGRGARPRARGQRPPVAH